MKGTLEWNSGAMVITPNRTVFEAMMERLPHTYNYNSEMEKYLSPGGLDPWNSGLHDQGFLSSFFTTDADHMMKTMPVGSAFRSDSLDDSDSKYFWRHRNHIFETIHFTTQKPWLGRTNPRKRCLCEALLEWRLSVEGLERYNLTVGNDYLRRCGSIKPLNATIPSHERVKLAIANGGRDMHYHQHGSSFGAT